jgi:LPXTG-site transpeptidase (sortase) family protein
LTIGSTTYVYRVTTTDVVYPDDVSLYYSGSLEQSITLIACHPPHSVALRIVTRATLIAVEG